MTFKIKNHKKKTPVFLPVMTQKSLVATDVLRLWYSIAIRRNKSSAIIILSAKKEV